MNLTFDSGKLLYGLGVAFALGALVYFARDVVFGLSITVTAALLFIAFVIFLLVGLQRDRDLLGTVSFAVSGLSYLVFVGYVVVRYTPGETAVFFLLAGSAVLFIGLGYSIREVGIQPSRQTTARVLMALLVVSASLVAVDALSGDVGYTVEVNDSATATFSGGDGDRDLARTTTELGTLTVNNPSVFTRAVDPPSIRACLVGVDDSQRSHLHVDYSASYDDASEVLAGGETRVHELQVSIRLETNQTGEQTFLVERQSDCGVTRSEPTILVVVD